MRLLSPSLTLSAVLLAGISGSAAVAQQQTQPPDVQSSPDQSLPSASPRHAPNPKRQAKKMAKELGLTVDQRTKLEPILATRKQQMQAVRTDNSLTPQDRNAKVHSIRQDSETQIEALLTDTQKQQYEQMKQNRHAQKSQQPQATSPSQS